MQLVIMIVWNNLGMYRAYRCFVEILTCKHGCTKLTEKEKVDHGTKQVYRRTTVDK